MSVAGNFNPRTREGCDATNDLAEQILYISIHAPVKGATTVYAPSAAILDFNPRTREGCDQPTALVDVAAEVISIHAPVKGATPSATRSRRDGPNFNPRTREGCDAIQPRPIIEFRRFQSTHP